MVRRQVVSYTVTCDVCGEEIPASGAGESSRRFSWNRGDYQVDVCSRHQVELSEILDQLKAFVDAGSAAAASRARGGRPAVSKSPRPRRSSGATAASNVAAIRAWALDHGHPVGDRGRIPSRLIAAYNQAQASEPAAPSARSRRPRKASVPTAD